MDELIQVFRKAPNLYMLDDEEKLPTIDDAKGSGCCHN
jgi:hypothetical protein